MTINKQYSKAIKLLKRANYLLDQAYKNHCKAVIAKDYHKHSKKLSLQVNE